MKNILMFLVAVLMSCHIIAQNTVTGSVIDGSDNTPIIGASVMVKGTTLGITSDINGQFSLKVPAGKNTLVISSVGYKTQEVNISGKKVIRVTLAPDTKQLEEVVVIGYGVQKKKLVTGATVEIKGDAVAKLNTTQVLGALQSQSPGVNIQSISGQPGDGFKISIRGAGTNGNTAPVYVIDGVSGGDINIINPADIERIDVLKDAASCAIYGARAANGVILITTKQGKQGKTQVSYDGNIGWQNVYKMPSLLTAKQYMQVQDQIAFNSGNNVYDWSKYISADLLKAYQGGSNPGTNWLEAVRNKNAVVSNHAINIIGGNDLSKFSTGIGYQYQDGIIGNIVKSDFRRFTFRLNSEHVLYRSGKLDVVKFGENVYYQHRQNQGVQIGNQYSNIISNALRANPCVPIYNSKGDYFMYDDLKSSGTQGWFNFNPYTGNPIANMVNNQSGHNQSKSYNLNTVGYLEIQPIQGLTYRGQVDYKQYSSSWRTFLPTYKINDSNDNRTLDQTTENMTTAWEWGTTNTLNYKFNVAKDHHFDALVGTEYSRQGHNMGDFMQGTATGNIFGDYEHAYFNNAANRKAGTLSGNPVEDHSILSYFGRVNYDYNETYMFSAIMRADGSSNFLKGHQWGYFPSFSAGWVVSNENFMKSTTSWLDFLKIRAGWGQNGNENIGAFGYAASYSFGDYGQYSFNNNKDAGTQGGYPTRLANPDLKWETSEQADLGLDARFFGGKASFGFDWYNKKTKDLLISVPVASETGYTTMRANAGTVKNTGIEVSLGWNDKINGDFTYGINLNMAYNKNKVTKINNESHYIEGGRDLIAQNTGYMARMQEGHPIGYFYGYKTAGVMQNQADVQNYLKNNCGGKAANSLQGTSIKPGDLMFVDTDHNGVINSDDKTDLGNPNPDVTMGLSFNCAYKGFDLSVTTFGAFGQQVARSWRKFTDGQFENYTTEVFKYWHGEGTSNKFPLLAPGNAGANWQNISDLYVENADYFRIKNITLGFDFKHLWKSCPFQQLRLYFAAQNLLTFTSYKGMDPENGMALNNAAPTVEPWVTGVDVGNYPQPRTYIFGVNIKF